MNKINAYTSTQKKDVFSSILIVSCMVNLFYQNIYVSLAILIFALIMVLHTMYKPTRFYIINTRSKDSFNSFLTYSKGDLDLAKVLREQIIKKGNDCVIDGIIEISRKQYISLGKEDWNSVLKEVELKKAFRE